MTYFSPNGNLDRAALRRGATQILAAAWRVNVPITASTSPYATLESAVMGWAVNTSTAMRNTPSGLANIMPIETLAWLVVQKWDTANKKDAEDAAEQVMRNVLNHSAPHKKLSLFPDSKSDAEYMKMIEGQLAALTAPPASPSKATETQMTTANTAAAMHPVPAQLAPIDPSTAKLIDSMMASVGLPGINELVGGLNGSNKRVENLLIEVEKVKAEAQTASSRAKGLVVNIGGNVSTAPAHGPIPALNSVSMRKADTMFGLKGAAAKPYEFDVPYFDWAGVHPDVPAIDPDYLFRPELLMATLRALLYNLPLWVSGHTGTGKSTAVTQIAARMNWPVRVLNLDSDISRMELMGRDGITQTAQGAVTAFIEGILPQALQGPFILICDEMDFGRPDIMYAMQRVLEGNGLTLAEDAGRRINPHPFFRIVATANTKGQGDESGLYQGARIQSGAFLDRFTVWEQVDYLSKGQLDELLTKRQPLLPAQLRAKVVQYVQEHQLAFTNKDILTPISPRGAKALSDAIVCYLALIPNAETAIDWALRQTVLNRAPETDRSVLKGIIDRVFK